MPDYKSMYFRLLGVYCNIMDMLKKVSIETEEMAMDSKDSIALPEMTIENPEDE